MTAAVSITLNQGNNGGQPIDIFPLVKAQLGYTQADSSHDEELAFAAQSAMAKYNQIQPRNMRTTITLLENILSYPLPDDFVSIDNVQVPSAIGYFNDFLYLPMIDTPASSLFGYSDYSFRMASERVIRQGILGELDHYAQSTAGFYLGGNPPQIYYMPIPTSSGLTSIVEYAADHANISTDPFHPEWNTLPGGHWKYIVRLMKWAISDMRGDSLLSSVTLSQFDGGLSQMTEAWKTKNNADRILSEVERALGTDVTVVVRS